MAEETITRADLRRKICRELRMPFFRRVSPTFSTAGTSSVSTLVDAKLTQADGTWNGSWLYDITSGESSMIRNFKADSDTAFLEKLMTTSMTGRTYEIHSIWTADEIHDAINEAIRSVRRTFPATLTYEGDYLVLCEEQLSHSLSALTNPWIINKIWMEKIENPSYGTVSSATSSDVTIPPALLPPAPVNLMEQYRITIYSGVARGQTRQITYGDITNPLGISPNWITVPSATSKFVLYNEKIQRHTWIPFNDFHLDSEEYPDTLYINRIRPEFYGSRLRIEYLSYPGELTTDSSTTIVPYEYIKAKACSILHGMALSNTKADKDTHYAEYKRYQEEADTFVVRNAPHMPGVRFRTPVAANDGFMTINNADNPLGW